jgi:glycosyltransferase involved in cell wall biosynthesis
MPCDNDVRTRLGGRDSNAFLVAIIGRLDPGKGVHIAITAVAALRRQGMNVHLAIVGSPGEDSGDYASQMRVLAHKRLADSHTFIEHAADVAALLGAVDAVVVPSVDEPFGLIALEAQSAGVPVVVSDSGGLPEFVHDNRDGLVVRTGDTESFAAALRRLIDDAPFRERLAKAARDNAEESHRSDKRAESILDVYVRAIRGAA